MAGSRRAEIGLYANAGKLKPGLRQAETMLGGFGRKVKSGISGALGGIGSFIARSLDPLGRGLDLIQSQADEVMNFEKSLARLQISQNKSTDEMAGFREEIGRVSEETGVARNDILRGATAYQALTGDTKGAAAASRTFARVAQATGSTVDDVATTAAALGQNLKIAPDDLEKAFSILNVQGKAGAIELRDLAGLMASLSAQAQRFKGGTGTQGLAESGAALQIIRRNFGSASEAATGYESLMSAIVKNAKKLEKAHVKVFDKDPKTGKKTLRGFSQIIESISRSKLMKDPTLLSKALGRVEAERALQALTSNWQDFQTLVNTTDVKSIGKDLDKYLKTPAGQMEQQWNRLKLGIAAAFTPARVEKFAEALGKVAKVIGPIADGLGKIVDAMSFLADGAAEAGKAAGEFVFGKEGDTAYVDPGKLDPEGTRKAAEALHQNAVATKAASYDSKYAKYLPKGSGAAPTKDSPVVEGSQVLYKPAEYSGGFTAPGTGGGADKAPATKQDVNALIQLLAATEARKKAEKQIQVNVKAGPGLSAQVDNDARHRSSPK